jgi:hypothetical protein
MVWKLLMVPFMMQQFNGRAGCWYPEVKTEALDKIIGKPPAAATTIETDYRKADVRAEMNPADGGGDYRKMVVHTTWGKQPPKEEHDPADQNVQSKWLRYINPRVAAGQGGSDYRKDYYYCNEELGVCSVEPPPEVRKRHFGAIL